MQITINLPDEILKYLIEHKITDHEAFILDAIHSKIELLTFENQKTACFLPPENEEDAANQNWEQF